VKKVLEHVWNEGSQNRDRVEQVKMKTQKAFTLLELLTVIAIIAILAAIIVPVYSRTKDSANRSSDIANMNALRSALQLYRVDQGGYPPQILGYATLYSSGPSIGQTIPATQLQSYLFPKRVQSIETLRPILNRAAPIALTTAVFPNQDPNAGAILDLNQDGAVTPADDVAGARQAYGPADGNVCFSPVLQAVAAAARCGSLTAAQFYSVSGYDVANTRIVGSSSFRTELRYARFWTNYAIGTGSDPSGVYGQGGSFDDPRQLGYNDPPEDTLITWNSYYRDFGSNGTLTPGRRDVALFIGGSARTFDSAALNSRSWRQPRGTR
jgi:prepilin-type N-terminal cleavage/methylation domain-containing protein